MSEIITSTEQEILIAHMVDRLPALRKKYGMRYIVDVTVFRFFWKCIIIFMVLNNGKKP